MAATYPVHYSVEPSQGFSRLQLLVRFVVFVAIGIVGLSFGAVFAFAYLALPVLAAVRPQSRGVSLDAVRWFAAFSAWTGLTTDHIPEHKADETVHVALDRDLPMTAPRSAILRIFTGLPSAFVLGFLCFIGAFVWLWAALTILLTEHVGEGARRYLVGLQRWSVRLLAYQGSLVDEYPPFSFQETRP